MRIVFPGIIKIISVVVVMLRITVFSIINCQCFVHHIILTVFSLYSHGSISQLRHSQNSTSSLTAGKSTQAAVTGLRSPWGAKSTSKAPPLWSPLGAPLELPWSPLWGDGIWKGNEASGGNGNAEQILPHLMASFKEVTFNSTSSKLFGSYST